MIDAVQYRAIALPVAPEAAAAPVRPSVPSPAPAPAAVAPVMPQSDTPAVTYYSTLSAASSTPNKSDKNSSDTDSTAERFTPLKAASSESSPKSQDATKANDVQAQRQQAETKTRRDVDLQPVVGDPQATIAKAEDLERLALRPPNPSADDTRINIAAAVMRQRAQAEVNISSVATDLRATRVELGAETVAKAYSAPPAVVNPGGFINVSA